MSTHITTKFLLATVMGAAALVSSDMAAWGAQNCPDMPVTTTNYPMPSRWQCDADWWICIGNAINGVIENPSPMAPVTMNDLNQNGVAVFPSCTNNKQTCINALPNCGMSSESGLTTS